MSKVKTEYWITYELLVADKWILREHYMSDRIPEDDLAWMKKGDPTLRKLQVKKRTITTTKRTITTTDWEEVCL